MISLNELKIRSIYYVKARNFEIAVWEGEKFIGIRYKFGSGYLFGELHYDSDPNFGTVQPIKEIGIVPVEIELKKDEEYEKDGIKYLRTYTPLYDLLKNIKYGEK